MQLQIIDEDLSVCKVTDYSGVELDKPFCFTGKTDEENSLVCRTEFQTFEKAAVERIGIKNLQISILALYSRRLFL